ncbi:glycosyltransferase [uncultured Hymenobacter sp.]|uniref:glycosyltransferase n=1 Tax=uncultured Hymenobacter sp. TaxID=170016 RepID=UPI0035CAF153
MISVIICSRGPAYRAEVTDNIAATIGVPYELVVVDNSANQYGICAAYNEGAARSRYEVLCFAHEDIEFRTPGWGAIVAEILRDTSIGVLGTAGGKWLAKVPSSWWGCGPEHLSINLHDASRDGQFSKTTFSQPEGQPLADVAAVDGLWLCTRKQVWAQFPFDAHTFPDFHFYDVDFCASVLARYRVCVTFRVDITHFSRGNFNDSWYVNADRFYRKHAHRLPLGTVAVSGPAGRERDYLGCLGFVLEIMKRQLPPRLGYPYLARCLALKPFSRDTLWLLRQYAKFAGRTRSGRPAGAGHRHEK